MQLSVVLPCFNEEANVAVVVSDTAAWMKKAGVTGEIVCVNDGSTDGTQRVLSDLQSRYPNLRIVTHEANIGYGSAVRDGCDSVATEWIAFMDGDGQFHAEDFSLLLPLCASSSMVVGRRKKRADPLMRKVNAKCFGILTWVSFGVWVRDVNCAMKIFRRDVWQQIRPRFATGALFNAELFARAKRRGVAWKQVGVSHYPRVRGAQTGARPGVILRMFRELFALRMALRSEK